jgi:hypothetical protein
MPSLGMLGAIGGAAKGFESFLSEELAMQRREKLENLRTSNDRETNRLSNNQRHENRLAEIETQNKNSISLTHLKQAGDLAVEQVRQQDDSASVEYMKYLTTPKEQGGAGLTHEQALEAQGRNSDPYRRAQPIMEARVDEKGNPVYDGAGNPIEDFKGYQILEGGSIRFVPAAPMGGQPAPAGSSSNPLASVKSLDEARQVLRAAAKSDVTDAQVDAKLQQLRPDLFVVDKAPRAYADPEA